ncbi:MAG: hypothetical protein ACRDK0_10540, partial [Solirubrobacteraceae bacterium]
MKSRSSGRYAVAAALILAIGIPSVAVGFGEGRDTRLGKRNPSRSALNAETQIIASNGSYGTRQSNKRNGDGGGAIYGCRSDPGREPCVRANNLKGGRAFEFQTVGKEAGQITVGDTTAPPFSTNATGKVANLDSDKLDGKDATEFAEASGLLFAAVNADGTLAAGKGATAAAKSAAGNTYTVTFSRDVSKCSFTASVTGGSSAFGIGAQPVAGQVNQVAFDEDDAAGDGG